MDHFDQKFQCLIHPNNSILYANIKDEQSEKIFYCEACRINDSSFELNNFITIQQVIDSKSDDDYSIQHWPPFKSINTKQQLLNLTTPNQCSKYIEQINKFFDQLKKQVNQILFERQKKMILTCNKISDFYQSIQTKYKEISHINQLKLIFEGINSKSKEKQYRDLLSTYTDEKNKEIQQFEDLLKQKDDLPDLFQVENPNTIKDVILSLTYQIDFFTSNQENSDSENASPYPKIDNSIREQVLQRQIKCEKTSILNQLQFIQSSKQSKGKETEIIQKSHDNKISFTSNNIGDYAQYFSNIELDRDRTYLIRFISTSNDRKSQGNLFNIGLVPDDKKDSTFFKLGQDFQFVKQLISAIDITDFSLIYGDFEQFPQNTVFQVKICINKGVFEISDYPNANHLLTIKEITELQNNKNLRLQIYLQHYVKLTITEALILQI